MARHLIGALVGPVAAPLIYVIAETPVARVIGGESTGMAVIAVQWALVGVIAGLLAGSRISPLAALLCGIPLLVVGAGWLVATGSFQFLLAYNDLVVSLLPGAVAATPNALGHVVLGAALIASALPPNRWRSAPSTVPQAPAEWQPGPHTGPHTGGHPGFAPSGPQAAAAGPGGQRPVEQAASGPQSPVATGVLPDPWEGAPRQGARDDAADFDPWQRGAAALDPPPEPLPYRPQRYEAPEPPAAAPGAAPAGQRSEYDVSPESAPPAGHRSEYDLTPERPPARHRSEYDLGPEPQPAGAAPGAEPGAPAPAAWDDSTPASGTGAWSGAPAGGEEGWSGAAAAPPESPRPPAPQPSGQGAEAPVGGEPTPAAPAAARTEAAPGTGGEPGWAADPAPRTEPTPPSGQRPGTDPWSEPGGSPAPSWNTPAPDTGSWVRPPGAGPLPGPAAGQAERPAGASGEQPSWRPFQPYGESTPPPRPRGPRAAERPATAYPPDDTPPPTTDSPLQVGRPEWAEADDSGWAPVTEPADEPDAPAEPERKPTTRPDLRRREP
ncbi:hypothetical protein [Allonocardiopsis opalescens]|uniref:Uncharacterized protein n=1 Tax=Allonocardiopsis opalescens TaxID=1144618 RepID=A0A2T0QC20_9ACTN|nr:hypothetical protein [Allonocardiopsis opalescens]PRY01452.1 hypothetical protein CLV72_10134 [Allonocardiopsis opalescens]